MYATTCLLLLIVLKLLLMSKNETFNNVVVLSISYNQDYTSFIPSYSLVN